MKQNAKTHKRRALKSEEQWKRILTPMQYHVLREKGTERPFTGKYRHHKEDGRYACAGCGQILFESKTKFVSGTGWPSFWEGMDDGSIETRDDLTHGMQRTEVVYSGCGGHLGHLFDDGPAPTGKRFCINSASLEFQKKAGNWDGR